MNKIAASIDVGDNITKLLTKLATQIGVAADKIFPWYVKQQVLEGWLFIIICSVLLILGSFFIQNFYKKANWKDEDVHAIFFSISIILTFVVLVTTIMGLGTSITQINNPEYHAMQSLVTDLHKLNNN